MSMRVALMAALTMWAGAVAAELPRYLWGEISVPEGAVEALCARAEELGIAVASWGEDGLSFRGVADEEELLAEGTYLYLDGELFLLVLDTETERSLLRGDQSSAELIVSTGTNILAPPSEAFLDLARELGLLSDEAEIGLSVKEIPLKLPRVPEGMHLDPVLWALVLHPDWSAAARDFGLERTGLRVRVVAEASGVLAEELERYVLSSTADLMDILIPIGLLPALGQDPAVRMVRPPYVPHPAGG